MPPKGYKRGFTSGVGGPGQPYDPEETAFLKAIGEYQKMMDTKFPAYSEILAVLKSMGYRKVEEAAPLSTVVKMFRGHGRKKSCS